jgi:hypothetical protein
MLWVMLLIELVAHLLNCDEPVVGNSEVSPAREVI